MEDGLERAYRDLGERALRSRAKVLKELNFIRVDLARFYDELSNLTKFFGDWHLAKVYESLRARFHLDEWHASLDQKVHTLDELYQHLQTSMINRSMLILETIIVLLFILDIALIFWGK